jgi:hypothetical protein
LIVGTRIFVNDRIPLVAYNDTGATIVRNLLRQDPILLRHSRRGIQHQKHHIGTANGAQGSIDHEKLWAEFDFALSAYTGRVDESVDCGWYVRIVWGGGSFHDGVDGIAGCSCNVADYCSVGSEDGVEERAFADVWSAYDCNVDFFL